MSRDRRARVTGRLGTKRGERYALVPEEVMNSPAYLAQPDWARCVLFALACRFQGHNNADLSLPFSEAKKLGIASQWKLYAGLQLLEAAGLIQRTRQGSVKSGIKYCTLFALDWRGLDQVEPQLDAGIGHCPLARNAWAKWTKPDDWADVVKDIQRRSRGASRLPVKVWEADKHQTEAVKRCTTLSGDGRTTLSGAIDTDIAPHCRVTESTVIAPHCRVASKISTPNAHLLHATEPPPTPSNSRSKARARKSQTKKRFNGAHTHGVRDEAP